MKTVAVIEFHSKGHHPAYLLEHARILLDRGCRVVACCPFPQDANERIRQVCGSAADRFSTCNLPMPRQRFSSTVEALSRWSAVSSVVARASRSLGGPVDLMFFNHLEDFLLHPPFHLLLRAMFPRPWAGLLLQPRRWMGEGRDGARQAFAILTSRSCRGVTIVDETACSELSGFFPKARLMPAPDFADLSLPRQESDFVAEIRSRSRGRTVVGLLGFLKKYKGILTLLEAARQADPGSFFFVFAGELVKEGFTQDEYRRITSFAESRPENCLFRFERIVDESEYNAVVAAVDVIFAAFEDFPHSSNTLTKAAAFRKPVVVSRGHCMDRRVQEFAMGSVVDQGDAGQVAAALNLIRRDYTDIVARARFAEYADRHAAARMVPLFERMLSDA